MFMKKKNKPFETNFHSLNGNAAMDLHRKEDLNALATKLIDNYNPDRFDAVALRFFVQKNEPIVTLYAVDKYKQEDDNYPKDKLPVKKYKLKLSFVEFLKYIKRFDLTVSNDAYDIADILVMNK
jgi:hypothetical protein